ncbi:MAG: LuxR C-terminal-related transcriptional regulator [Methyloligellaceae bacterium]
MYERIRVAVVDYQPIFRQGVCHVIASSRRCMLVAQGADHEDAVRIAQTVMPQVLLLDVNLPGGGIDALRVISRVATSIKTIMLSAAECEDELSASFNAGARGYVTKNGVGPKQLIEIVHSVHEGGVYTEPSVAAALLVRRYEKKKNGHDLTESLSQRERDILDLVAEGMTNKEIALHHKIAEKTVKHYMTSILHKLQARNRVEAALMARNQTINHSRLASSG